MSAIIMMMAVHQMQQNQRMMQQRMRMMEESRRARERERKRREEEEQRLIEHRKNSPVVCNEESWQIDRCVKAISLQPCVQSLVSTMEAVKPKVIEVEEKKFDEEILDTGYKYEVLKNEIDNDIKILKELGISITGKKYKLTRLAPANTHIARIEQVTESFGDTFTINNGQPIEINPIILNSNDYYEERYNEMHPEKVENEFIEINHRVHKYQKIGKYLRFILKIKKYLELEDEASNLKARHETCELRKKEMDSYKSLTKEQLVAIRTYFNNLSELESVSKKISGLFTAKAALRTENNEEVDQLVVNEIMSNGEHNDLLAQVYAYINKIYANDEVTMQEAYDLVKGEYPIHISRRYIYDLIIRNIRNMNKEDSMKLKLDGKKTRRI